MHPTSIVQRRRASILRFRAREQCLDVVTHLATVTWCRRLNRHPAILENAVTTKTSNSLRHMLQHTNYLCRHHAVGGAVSPHDSSKPPIHSRRHVVPFCGCNAVPSKLHYYLRKGNVIRTHWYYTVHTTRPQVATATKRPSRAIPSPAACTHV